MKAIKTVKCKFQVNIEQAAALLEIPQQFAGACNDTFRVFRKKLCHHFQWSKVLCTTGYSHPQTLCSVAVEAPGQRHERRKHLLKQLSGKERRMADLNQKISKATVRSCKHEEAIVMKG